MKSIMFLGIASAMLGFGLGWLLPSHQAPGSSRIGTEWQSVLTERTHRIIDSALRSAALEAMGTTADQTIVAQVIDSQIVAIMDPTGMVGSLSEPAWRRDSLATELAFRLLAERDSRQALALAKGLPDRMMRTRFLAIAIDAVGKVDYEQGLELLEESAYQVHKPPRFIFQDPAAAAKFYESLPSSRLKDGLIDALPMAWASVDPGGAMDWTLTQHQSVYQQQGIMKAWARKDLSAMTDYLTTLPESRDKTLISGRVAGTLIQEQDVDTALAWADAHVSPDVLPSVVKEALTGLVRDAPEKAMAIAISRGAQPEKVIETWAYEDGHAATLWASKVADPALSETLTQQALRMWSGRDPGAAAAQVDHWFNDGQSVPEETLTTVGARLGARDPVMAMNWAATLPDPAVAGAVVQKAIGYFENYSSDQIIAAMARVPVHLIDERSAKSVQSYLSRKDSVEAADEWMANIEKQRREAAP